MAFIETRFRRCCSFRSRRAIGGGSVRRRRSLARSWRGSTRVKHGDGAGGPAEASGWQNGAGSAGQRRGRLCHQRVSKRVLLPSRLWRGRGLGSSQPMTRPLLLLPVFCPCLGPKRALAGLGRVCVYRWARARSRLDMAVGGSTRDTQAIPPPTGRMSTQNRMAFCIFISDSYVIF